MKVKDLKPAKWNPRKIDEWQLRSLKKAMMEFGALSGIVFNVQTGNVVGGHQRIKHLDPAWKVEKVKHKDKVGTVAIGYIETDFGRWQYREVDWDEKKELAANVAANKHGGEWDYPLLKDIFVEVDDGSRDMDLLGFENDELNGLFDLQARRDAETNASSEQSTYADPRYAIKIACDDESQQKKMLNEFIERGWTCQALIL